jgi:tight adherence protein B
MIRAGVCAALAALVCTSVAVAAPGTRVTNVDLQSYPQVVVNAVTPTPTTRPPRLLENGQRAVGVHAVNLGAAKSMVVAIDNSQSMSGAPIANAAAAAREFIDAKSSRDRISVVAFGRHALQLTGFATSAAQADSALDGLAVDSVPGTALYDAVVAAARSLRPAENGKVIVVLTDGRDVSSLSSLEQAVTAARRADAAVYTIGIEGSDFEPAALRELSRATGGTYHAAGSSAELQQVYSAIGSELERTWRLTYATAARPGEAVELGVAAAGAGTAHASVHVPTSLGGTTGPPPSKLLPDRAYNPFGTLAVALLSGLLVLLALVSLVRPRRGSWVQRRLAAHVGEAKDNQRSGDRLAFLKVLFQATENALGRRSEWRSIERMLVRGDVPLRAAEFVWLMAGTAIGAAFLFTVARAPLLLTLVGVAAGASAPYLFVALRVRKRAKAFEDQLPDMLTTIAASLKAGHSFKHGLQAVVEEAQPPASNELKRVLTEAGLGRPLDDALGDMAERVGSENFAFAITAVTIQRQVGGSMASLFDMVADSVRNRQQFARKIRSLTAMGRMSAYTLMGVPFFICGMVSIMNPGYMAPLFHTHVGHILVFIGAGMMAVGSLILKKIVSFRG